MAPYVNLTQCISPTALYYQLDPGHQRYQLKRLEMETSVLDLSGVVG